MSKGVTNRNTVNFFTIPDVPCCMPLRFQKKTAAQSATDNTSSANSLLLTEQTLEKNFSNYARIANMS
jgi:hypothetical protein